MTVNLAAEFNQVVIDAASRLVCAEVVIEGKSIWLANNHNPEAKEQFLEKIDVEYEDCHIGSEPDEVRLGGTLWFESGISMNRLTGAIGVERWVIQEVSDAAF